MGKSVFFKDGYVPSVCPVFSEFQYKLTHGGKPALQLGYRHGGEFFCALCLLSGQPCKLASDIMPKKFIIEFMTILIVLKTGLSGLSFSWYLKKHFGVKFGVGFLVFFYALSGYMACLQLEHHVAGLHHAVSIDSVGSGAAGKGEEGDALLHYAGPLHPFQLLYFHHDLHFHGYLCDCSDDAQSAQKLWEFMGTGLRFAFYSLLAGGLAAVVLCRRFMRCRSRRQGDFDFPKTFSSYFSIFDMIARHIEMWEPR